MPALKEEYWNPSICPEEDEDEDYENPYEFGDDEDEDDLEGCA